MIAPDDRGFTLGDGLFETILADHGELVAFEAHTARLAAGCRTLGLPTPDIATLWAEASAALAKAGVRETRAAVRLTWTAGSGGRGLDRPGTLAPALVVTAAPAPRPETAARLITASIRRNETSPASRLKTLSYLDNILARAQATAVGADEALMLNTRGEIACATVANVFWLKDGVLHTPALDCGVLAGIARAEVMARLEVREVRAGPETLASAEALILTSSLIGARAVAALDGRTFDQQVGQATVLLMRGRR